MKTKKLNLIKDVAAYNQKEFTISALRANLLSPLIILPFVTLFILLFTFVWGIERMYIYSSLEDFFYVSSGGNFQVAEYILYLTILLFFFGGIVIHEFLHGLGWSISCKNGFKSIEFGVKWNSLTPYTHCKEPLKAGAYKFGAALPGILMGFLPAILGILLGNILIFVIGNAFLFAAGGDFLSLWMARKISKDTTILDHPDKIGFIIVK
jgi:hypothetical protein